MKSLGVVILQIFRQTSLGGVANRNDVDGLAAYHEVDAEFLVLLAVEENPHILAVSVCIGIDGASERAGFQRVDFRPDGSCPT
jgi:hypothetical protein